MVATVGSISIDLSTNAAKFTQGFKSAATTVDQQSSLMANSLSKIDKAAGIAATGFKAFIGGAVAQLGLNSFSAAIDKTVQALAGFEDIGNVSRQAGITAKSFQELSFAALETDVSQEQLNNSLAIFARNAGQAEQGTGALYSGLKQINSQLLRSILSTDDQGARLRMVADAMSRMTGATEKAALAVAVFGRGGQDMVRLLEGGSAALDEFAAKAEALGVVVSDEDVARYAEASDQIQRMAFVLDKKLSAALAHVAPLIEGGASALLVLAEGAGAATEAISQLGDVTNDFYKSPSFRGLMDLLFGKRGGGNVLRDLTDSIEETILNPEEFASWRGMTGPDADAAAAAANAASNPTQTRRPRRHFPTEGGDIDGDTGGRTTRNDISSGGVPMRVDELRDIGGSVDQSADTISDAIGLNGRELGTVLYDIGGDASADTDRAASRYVDASADAADDISGSVEDSGPYITGRFDDSIRAQTGALLGALGSLRSGGGTGIGGSDFGGARFSGGASFGGNTSWAGRQITIGGGGDSYTRSPGGWMKSAPAEIAESGAGSTANINVVVKPVMEGQRLSTQSSAEIKQAASAGANAALRAFNGR